MKDAEIISKESFAVVVEVFQERIFRFCFHLLGSTEDARDATSEVFMKTFVSLSAYDKNQQFSSWLFRIAYNHCIDHLRKKNREKWFLRSSLLSESPGNQNVVSAEDHCLINLERQKVRKALKKLPHKQFTSLLLRYHFELSYKEISQILNKPVTSIRILLFRAKKQLRKILEEGT